MTPLTSALAGINTASAIMEQLPGLVEELALVTAHEMLWRAQVFDAQVAQGANASMAKETALSSTSGLRQRIIGLQGKIDAYVLELAHCDRIISYFNTRQ